MSAAQGTLLTPLPRARDAVVHVDSAGGHAGLPAPTRPRARRVHGTSTLAASLLPGPTAMPSASGQRTRDAALAWCMRADSPGAAGVWEQQATVRRRRHLALSLPDHARAGELPRRPDLGRRPTLRPPQRQRRGHVAGGELDRRHHTVGPVRAR
ncbi:hypothetical protein JHW43_002979 [Diplocarpon mali]|nr:hypothetical protein JHW43_002979 [Diplocarpon mali]